MPKGKAPRATKKARANQASTETTSTIASSSQAVVENNEEPSTSPVLAASNSPRYTSFDTPQFRHAPDPECRIRNTHRVGRFCHDCGGISMPWNENNQISHPIARRPDGTVIERSPPGSILDGLALTNAYEITAVSILLSVNEEALGAVPQLGELVRRDPNRKIVSDRISSIIDHIELTLRQALLAAKERKNKAGIAAAERAYDHEKRPMWWEVFDTALREPNLTRQEYLERIKQQIPGFVFKRLTPEPEASRKDAQRFYSMDALEIFDSDVEGDEDNQDEELEAFQSFPASQKNAPAGYGITWKWIEGQDLEPAELGKPDAGKFFMVRYNVAKPAQIDIRRYIPIAGFDWNSKAHLQRLNKHRNQQRLRVDGAVNVHRLPWSVREYEELKRQVQEQIAAGKNRKTIDWEEMAKSMGNAFAGIIQPKGSPLKSIMGAKAKLLFSAKDREGFYRGGSGIRIQADKYTDISQLLDEADKETLKPIGRGPARGTSTKQKSPVTPASSIPAPDGSANTGKSSTPLATIDPQSPTSLKRKLDEGDTTEEDDEQTKQKPGKPLYSSSLKVVPNVSASEEEQQPPLRYRY